MKTKLWMTCLRSALVLLGTLAHGQTFTVRPSTYSSNDPGYNDPSYAFDGNLATFSWQSITQYVKGATVRSETWSGFPPAPPGATGMQLHITSSASVGHAGYTFLSYNLGSTGATVYILYNNATRPEQTDVIPLSDTQDLTQISVKAYVDAINANGTSTAAQNVYEIWVSGND